MSKTYPYRTLKLKKYKEPLTAKQAKKLYSDVAAIKKTVNAMKQAIIYGEHKQYERAPRKKKKTA